MTRYGRPSDNDLSVRKKSDGLNRTLNVLKSARFQSESNNVRSLPKELSHKIESERVQNQFKRIGILTGRLSPHITQLQDSQDLTILVGLTLKDDGTAQRNNPNVRASKPLRVRCNVPQTARPPERTEQHPHFRATILLILYRIFQQTFQQTFQRNHAFI